MGSELVVVGGGLVGLAAAWGAARAGASVIVLEQSDRLGGRVGGTRDGSPASEPLAHRLVGPLPAALWRELEQLVPGGLRPGEVTDRLLVDGSWVPAPLRARPAIGDLVGPALARQLWGVPDTALEPASIASGLDALGLVDPCPVTRPARRRPARPWWRVDGGLSRWVEALASGVAAAGGELRLGRAVDGVRPDDGAVHVHTDDGAILTARRVVLAVPLPTVLGLLPVVPHPVRNAVAAMRWRSIVSVLLEVPAPVAAELDGRWFPGSDTPLLRLAEVGPGASGATAVLSAEMAVTRDDPLWLAPDDQLVELVGWHLERSGLSMPAPFTTRVHRVPEVLPVPRRGAAGHRAVVAGWLADWPGLVVARPAPLVPHLAPHRLLVAGWAAAASVTDQPLVSSAIA